MSTFPVNLQRDNQAACLIIEWDDGTEQRVTYRILRDRCPCAGCRASREEQTAAPAGGLRILSPAETRPLEILAMTPVGNYAYNIQFSDDHNTGIFTFEFLRELGTEA